MSYQVLARKWRPRSFKDMVGQEAVVRMLSNALEQNRLHHAYLFTGTRGVGKTTIARIIAKCLNCETGVTSTPCDTCNTCVAIDKGQFLDLFEVDAASRTKVEDTRELLDNVLYPPTQGRYKVYLIDEVHMLSNHSFNALLKTLEEPPEHVKFLLATTDPKRLPITILSRCLQFHLKRISPEHIAAHLQHLCTAENISAETPALTQLAKAADGSLRDALSLLDQAIAYSQGKVITADVQAMLGSMSQEDLLPLVEAVLQNNGALALQAVAQLAERAPDFQQVLEALITLFHQVAITQIIPNTSDDANVNTLATLATPETIQLYYQIALLCRRDLAYSPNAQQGFEMAVLRMLAFSPNTATTSTKPLAPPKTVATTAAKPATPAQQAPIAANTSGVEWRDLITQLGLTGMAYALASNCTLTSLNEQKMVLGLAAAHQPMLSAKLKERLAEAISKHFNRPMQLDILISAEPIETPQKQAEAARNQRLSNAKKDAALDPRVQALVDMYDATVEVTLTTT
ncbi:MAG TPA: DNA polymerase III subunit gamma/tau [Gammaproteobacteria bacterium]|nr:DNA polymerase III subunit gamma/tau [Gammaproteobacteria bacterium]